MRKGPLFIELTLVTGKKILVNPEFIGEIHPGEQTCKIVLAYGQNNTKTVKDTMEEILDKILRAIAVFDDQVFNMRYGDYITKEPIA